MTGPHPVKSGNRTACRKPQNKAQAAKFYVAEGRLINPVFTVTIKSRYRKQASRVEICLPLQWGAGWLKRTGRSLTPDTGPRHDIARIVEC